MRQAISTSFRAVPELLAFVNALGGAMTGAEDLDDRWEYRDADRFPVPGVAAGARRDGRAVLGVVAEDSLARSAAAVAHEISRIIGRTVVRDRSGAPRPAQADDIAILFRARAGHRYFEDALDARGVRTYVYKGLGFFDAPEVQDLQALVRYLAQPDSDLRAAELLRSRLVRLSDRALVALAPALARALLEGDVDPGSLGLDGIDAALFERARTGVRRWLALADRLPPSELVDVVLRESAYLVELGGRRMDQARENAKKVRALVRRVENRGYATLGRLAAYFDTLSAGDDSNAIVEAAGAVSLMTVHAAKGLEFPIVFVVNLHASGRGRSAGVSVIETGPSGEPDVAFRRTAATVLEDRREIEELRRLLYVAATRARDRLYLAAEIDAQGRLRRGARSLAGLLPASLAATFERAAASDEPEAEWDSGHGTFAFAICRAPKEAAPEPATAGDEPAGPEVPAATPLSAVGLVIEAATAQARTMPSGPAARGHRSAERRSERLAGTLVHRMFQRRFDAGADDAVLLPAMAELASLEERVDITDWAGLCRAALELYRAMRGRADVAALVEGGRCLYEVPFSYLPPDRPGVCIRGVVDCLVEGADGALTVLEFKTGGPRDEHRVQAEFYGRAMESAIGRGPVRAVVCYPERTLQEKHCM